jgi:hypothetical protein
MKGDRSPSEDIEIIIRFCNSIESAMEHFGKDEEDFLGSSYIKTVAVSRSCR